MLCEHSLNHIQHGAKDRGTKKLPCILGGNLSSLRDPHCPLRALSRIKIQGIEGVKPI